MRWLIHAVALAGLLLTLFLGQWQWGRGQQKIAMHEAIVHRMAEPPVPTSGLLAAKEPTGLLHRAVLLRGTWLREHTVYLENRPMRGQPGFEVVTPLKLDGGAAVVLVQRGWIPRSVASRDVLAPVQTPEGLVDLQGRIAPAPGKLLEMGPAATGPIRQNLDIAAFRDETRLPLLDVSVLQTGAPSEGLLREWPEISSGAQKNFGYAFQWWAMSALIVVLHVWFQFIAPRRKARSAR